MTRPARVIFDAGAVRANLQVVKARAPGRRIMAIVKADAYGHGVVRMAHALDDVDALGVASIEEAVRLREAGIAGRIVLLEGPFDRQELPEIAIHRLESVVHTQEQVRMFAAHPDPIALWIKVDTGMHRLGFAPAEVADVVNALGRTDRTLRLMTHFASAHLVDDPSVAAQAEAFRRVDGGGDFERCCANSSAIIAWPATHAEWIRPGLMLYGVSPLADVSAQALGLRPAMTVASALIAVKRVAAGGAVGYGRGFVCPEDMDIGVVAFGYADGYPRHAATGTPVLVNGVRTQVIGEASMDMMAVDLRPVGGARAGDPVVLWGDGLPVEDIARAAGTIPYELLCRMRMRAQFVER
ncbi:MAG: alanine racemase [Gammaproteobacteria bacterium]